MDDDNLTPPDTSPLVPDDHPTLLECPECDGHGRVPEPMAGTTLCRTCNGVGQCSMQDRAVYIARHEPT